MTNEEAIERINEHIAIHRYNEPQAIRIAEALQMAVEALEHPEEMLTCEGCKYNDGRKINSPCSKCMRADSDWYEAEDEV